MSQGALSMLEIDETSKQKNADELSVINSDASPLSVSVKNLCFSYKGATTETLKGLTLEIPAGSQAAFIGPSGAGKSTLADLLLGLLNPTSGEIKVGGSNPIKLLTGQPGLVGYVPQKPGMISGSIIQNIALGLPEQEVDFQKLWKAIKDAHLNNLVDSLPDGVYTNIGKRKDQLSGGQLQRIGLARALYSEPRLLIMDEATSALDAESEHEINRILDEMRGKVTVILIAHRLNTIQRSDVVHLVENGTITASGLFSELRRKNSRVKNLVKLMEIESSD
jgi:ATP-binding cassette subfamily C protein